MTTPLQEGNITRQGHTIPYSVFSAPEYDEHCQDGETPIRVLAPTIALDHL